MPLMSHRNMLGRSTPSSQDSTHTPPRQPPRGVAPTKTVSGVPHGFCELQRRRPLGKTLDMITDTALDAAVDAVQAPGTVVSELCDAMHWVATEGTVHAITSVSGVWTPRGPMLTATATFAASGADVRIVEHIPLALVQGGPLLEYVSKDPSSATSSLVTRWSPSHAPISLTRLRHLTPEQMYHPKEKAPSPDADTAPDMQNQKVTHTLQKSISQSLPEHLRPMWDRLKVREVVSAFWAIPNDVHNVLQAAHIPTIELIPLKHHLLVWASSVCLTGQLTAAPVVCPPPPPPTNQQGTLVARPAPPPPRMFRPADPHCGALASDKANGGTFLGHRPHVCHDTGGHTGHHRTANPHPPAMPRTSPAAYKLLIRWARCSPLPRSCPRLPCTGRNEQFLRQPTP